MGNSADRAWQLSQLVEGVSTACNPSAWQPVLRRNKLRIFRFHASTEAKDTQLASTRSSRAPCAFPNLRCYPRCWLFSCLGLWSHPPYFPKEHQKERCDHSRSQRPFITFHGALWNILLSADLSAVLSRIPSDFALVNIAFEYFSS